MPSSAGSSTDDADGSVAPELPAAAAELVPAEDVAKRARVSMGGSGVVANELPKEPEPTDSELDEPATALWGPDDGTR